MNGREKINLEDIAFLLGRWEVAAIAAIVFKGRPNIPANKTMGAKGSATVGSKMGNNPGARGGKRCAVEIKVTKDGSMSGKRRMDARGS